MLDHALLPSLKARPMRGGPEPNGSTTRPKHPGVPLRGKKHSAELRSVPWCIVRTLTFDSNGAEPSVRAARSRRPRISHSLVSRSGLEGVGKPCGGHSSFPFSAGSALLCSCSSCADSPAYRPRVLRFGRRCLSQSVRLRVGSARACARPRVPPRDSSQPASRDS